MTVSNFNRAPKYESQSTRIRVGAAALSLLLISGSNPESFVKKVKAASVGDVEQAQALTDERLIQELKSQEEENAAINAEMEQRMKHKVTLPWLPESISQYGYIFEHVSQQHDIKADQLAVVAWLETKGGLLTGPSSAGAQGYMQIMPSTAREAMRQFSVEQYDPGNDVDSIEMAARVVAMQREWLMNSMPHLDKDFFDRPEVVLAAYNGGPGAAQDFIESNFNRAVLPQETQHYVEKGVRYLQGETPEELTG